MTLPCRKEAERVACCCMVLAGCGMTTSCLNFSPGMQPLGMAALARWQAATIMPHAAAMHSMPLPRCHSAQAGPFVGYQCAPAPGAVVPVKLALVRAGGGVCTCTPSREQASCYNGGSSLGLMLRRSDPDMP